MNLHHLAVVVDSSAVATHSHTAPAQCARILQHIFDNDFNELVLRVHRLPEMRVAAHVAHEAAHLLTRCLISRKNN